MLCYVARVCFKLVPRLNSVCVCKNAERIAICVHCLLHCCMQLIRGFWKQAKQNKNFERVLCIVIMPEIVRQAELIMGVVVVSAGPRSLFFIFLLYFIFLLSLFLYNFLWY